MKNKYKKAVVTGGAGFIGSHLVEALLINGCHVTVIDNLSTGSLSNLEQVKDHIVFFETDIRDQDALTRATKGCDIIFHQAATLKSERRTVARKHGPRALKPPSDFH